jgi:hypothetical protein
MPHGFLIIITNAMYCVGLLRGRKIPIGQMQENMDTHKLFEVEDLEAN